MPSTKSETQDAKSKFRALGEKITAPIRAALVDSDKDFFGLIERQHRRVEDLFAEFESTSKSASKKKESLFTNIAAELSLHANLEEKILYPRLKDIEPTLALEAYEEHALVKELIRKISKMDPKNESYEAKVIVLKEIVEHHVREEEDDLIPKMRSIIDEPELESMTEEALTMMDHNKNVPQRKAGKQAH